MKFNTIYTVRHMAILCDLKSPQLPMPSPSSWPI